MAKKDESQDMMRTGISQ